MFLIINFLLYIQYLAFELSQPVPFLWRSVVYHGCVWAAFPYPILDRLAFVLFLAPVAFEAHELNHMIATMPPMLNIQSTSEIPTAMKSSRFASEGSFNLSARSALLPPINATLPFNYRLVFKSPAPFLATGNREDRRSNKDQHEPMHGSPTPQPAPSIPLRH